MADVESFINWALAQGVTLNGIAALRRPGTGVGFIAERTIEVCAVICFFLSFLHRAVQCCVYSSPTASQSIPLYDMTLIHKLHKTTY